MEPLSERELEVLRLLATDLDGPEIARELVVSLNTIRTHTKSDLREARREQPPCGGPSRRGARPAGRARHRRAAERPRRVAQGRTGPAVATIPIGKIPTSIPTTGDARSPRPHPRWVSHHARRITRRSDRPRHGEERDDPTTRRPSDHRGRTLRDPPQGAPRDPMGRVVRRNEPHHERDGTTFIHGPVADQAALHGLLQKVRDTGLPLVSVIRVEPDLPQSRNPGLDSPNRLTRRRLT